MLLIFSFDKMQLLISKNDLYVYKMWNKLLLLKLY